MSDSQEKVYAEFSKYDWDLFTEFQEGLQEIMQHHLKSLSERDPSVTTIPAAERQQLTDQAKSFFFCSSTGHILNLDDYYAWKRVNGGKIQLLDDDKKESSGVSNSDPSEASYSSNYQNIVDSIVPEEPVPGIKEIPYTVLTDQKSASKAEKRVKPWEEKSVENRDTCI